MITAKEKKRVYLELAEPIIQQRVKLRQLFIPSYFYKDNCITPIYPDEFYVMDKKLEKIQKNIFEGVCRA